MRKRHRIVTQIEQSAVASGHKLDEPKPIALKSLDAGEVERTFLRDLSAADFDDLGDVVHLVRCREWHDRVAADALSPVFQPVS